jgi:uncharacterized protein DUF4234
MTAGRGPTDATQMATEALVRDGDASVKLRNPVKSGLLDALTLGVYGIFWFYYVNRELADLGRARGTTELGVDPQKSLLAMFPGLLVLVPAILAFHNFRGRVRAAQRIAGIEPASRSAPASVGLFILFPIGIYVEQTELGKVWAKEALG